MRVFHLKHFDRNKIKLAVNLQRWKKGDSSEEHLHDCVEMMFILSGSGINLVNHRSYPIISGDLYIINRGSTHSFYASSALVFYNLMFSFSLFSRRELRLYRNIEGFDAFFNLKKSDETSSGYISKLFLPPPWAEKIRKQFELLHTRNHADPLAQLDCKANLMLLLNEIMTINRTAKECQNLAAPDLKHDSLTRILDYLNRNFLKELTVDNIAAAANLSPTYVGEFFRNRTGMRLMKYVNTLRIEQARVMLTAASEKNITEIATACGFEDSSYFARVFHEATGFSPSEYRNISGQ